MHHRMSNKELVGGSLVNGDGGTYLYTIGGQEQNTLEVLEETQENGHKCIAVNILDGSLLQKHICLIKE
jgi:hypothetical protein